MQKHETTKLAAKWHQQLPQEIRQWLREVRGLSDQIIDRHMIGWTGTRISIPVFGPTDEILIFRFARHPDKTDETKMLSVAGTKAELYGWDNLKRDTDCLIICEGEFDRLVLESNGFAAVTSTAGAATFRREWATAIVERAKSIFICFDRDAAGETGARRVADLIPSAKIVRLPAEVGQGGDVTDFFVRLSKSHGDFLQLLADALPMPKFRTGKVMDLRATLKRATAEIDRLKTMVSIEQIICQVVKLHRSGMRWRGHCPFHRDSRPSFFIYPESRHFHCYGCGAHGDILDFLMRFERLPFSAGLARLRQLAGTGSPTNLPHQNATDGEAA